jgi:hypothetical protein
MFDESVQNLVLDLSNDVFRGGSGLRGVVGDFTGDDTFFALATRSDVRNFEKGMHIRFAATETGALLAESEDVIVTAVDRLLGTIETGLDLDTVVTSFATTNFIFMEGDAPNNTGTFNKIRGMAAWLPLTVAPSESFFGVDRSTDRTRLAGLVYDGAGQAVEEAVLDASTLCWSENATPDIFVANPVQIHKLAKSMQAKAEYSPSTMGTNGKFYAKSYTIETGVGTIQAMGDPGCPVLDGYLLSKDTWQILSAGQVPHLADEDGLAMLRGATTDSYEVRFRYWAQLVCTKPSANCRIQLSA